MREAFIGYIIGAVLVMVTGIGFEHMCQYGEEMGIVKRHKKDEDKPER